MARLHYVAVCLAMPAIVGTALSLQLVAEELSIPEFRTQLLTRCRAAASAVRTCSGDAVVKHIFPLNPTKSGANYSRFGFDAERSYAIFGGKLFGDYLTDHPGDFAGDAPLVEYVAVSTPGLSFELARPDGDAAYVLRGIAAQGDRLVDQIKVQIGAACGNVSAASSVGFLDLSQRLESDEFVIETLRHLDGRRYEFEFRDRDRKRTYHGRITYDLELGGITSSEINGEEQQATFQHTVRVAYRLPAQAAPMVRSVVTEFTVNGSLRQRVETEIRRFSWEPPDERAFDIRTYGLAGAQPPASSRLPRLVTFVLILALILVFVGVAWQTRKRNVTTRRT